MSSGRNFLVNLGGNLLGLALFAALTPLYFHAIGAERYGVITVILSLSMYVSTFNFGMGPALTYQLAGALRDDPAAQSDAYWSAMALSTPIGIVASILIFGLLPVGLADLMHLSPGAMRELRGAMLPLVGIGMSIILVANVRGVWNGRQAFLTLAIFSSIDTALTIVLPVLTALYVSTSISALLYATLVARLTTLVGAMASCWVGAFARHWPRLSMHQMRAMLGYGGWVSFGTLVETLVSSADRLVLGTVAGAAQIAIYNIPLSVTSRAMIVPLSLLASVFPRLIATADQPEQPLLSKTIRFMLLLTPGYALVAAIAVPVLHGWLSTAFANTASWSLQILALAMWLEAMAAIFFYQLNARGDARANFLTAAFVTIPYCALLVAGAWWLGATGVALAYLLRNLLYFSGRCLFARPRGRDLRAIAANAVPLSFVVVLAPHDLASLTWQRGGLTGAALLLCAIVSVWTRPHDWRAMLHGLLPARFGAGGGATT